MRMWQKFDWAKRRASSYSDVAAKNRLQPEAFRHVFDFFDTFFKDEAIDLHLVTTSRQSARITNRETESAVFFDINQSYFLKNILRKISLNEDCVALANVYIQSAALYISAENKEYATILANLTTDKDYKQHYYFVSQDQLDDYEGKLAGLRRILPSPIFSDAVDWYIIGHEVYHYRKYTEPDKYFGFVRAAEGYFDEALTECCYEDRPDFKEIATYWGQLDIDDAGLESIRNDLVNRRAYYLSNKDNLVEEIACDLFSFHSLMNSMLDNFGDDVKTFREFSAYFYLLFNIFDLHFAMNRRATLSYNKGIDADKPADIADINLRKVALIYIMFDNYSNRLVQKYGAANTEGLPFEVFKTEIANLKHAIDHLYIMPITVIVRGMLYRAEECHRILVNIMNEEKTSPYNFDESRLFNTSTDDGIHKDILATP
jgi:hypothetical protein